MERTDGRARVRRITLLFTATYFVSYMTRVNYGAVLVEMIADTGWSKALLSVALTVSFITYGVGQIVSGVIADRFSPKKTVAAGIGVSALMNLLIVFCARPWQTAAVWGVNGFSQALLWPPIVRLMTENFDGETYKKASVRVIYGSTLGTVAVYLLSPLMLRVFGNFRAVFCLSAALAAVMLPVWLRLAPEGQKREEAKPGAPAPKKGALAAALLAPVTLALMLAIAFQGMLRDGVTTWMPTLLSESFNLDNGTAILSGVVLPVFGMGSIKITSLLYRKKLKNPLLCAGVIFCFGALCAGALILANGRSVIATVLLTALLIASMHGVNLIMTCMIPPYFRSTGRVSTVSGVLNACTYVGSAVSTYLIAVVSDISWTLTLALWCGVAFSGTLLCFLCVRPWKNKEEDGGASADRE